MRVGIRQLPGRKYFYIENDMERRNFIKLGTGAAIGGALTACGGGGGHYRPIPTPPPTPEPVRAKLVIGWNRVVLAAIRSERSPAPRAGALAIVHTAIYNAWAAYDAKALSTQTGARPAARPPSARQANQLRALSYAAYAALLDQFPGQQAAFDAHMSALAYNPARASLDPTTPEGIGTVSARALIVVAHADGANQLGNLGGGAPFADYSAYIASNQPLIVAKALVRNAIAAPAHWQPLTFLDAMRRLADPDFPAALLGPAAPVRPEQRGRVPARSARPARHRSLCRPGQRNRHAPGWPDRAAKGHHRFLVRRHHCRMMSCMVTWSQFAQAVSARDHYIEENDVKLFFAIANALSDA
ncbi:hypothetical protein LP419_33980 [Massilia sp. H-1]|nr:hypothetical protein LP419_33980 [Massilia sp. H-1]